MARFDRDLWEQIGKRLRGIRGDRSTMAFLVDHGLSPQIPWNRIELGNRGLDVSTLAGACEHLDVSPTWLIFGIGHKKLSELATRDDLAAQIIDSASALGAEASDFVDFCKAKAEATPAVPRRETKGNFEPGQSKPSSKVKKRG